MALLLLWIVFLNTPPKTRFMCLVERRKWLRSRLEQMFLYVFQDVITLHHIIICHYHCLQMEVAGFSVPLTSSNAVFVRTLLKVCVPLPSFHFSCNQIVKY